MLEYIKVVEREYLLMDYLEYGQDTGFNKIYEINNLFGHNHKGWMKASCPHKFLDDIELWYPKFNSGGEWVNEITADRMTIYESNVNPLKNKQALSDWLSTTRPVRYVFSRLNNNNSKSENFYFFGVYTLNISKSVELQKAVRERTDTIVKTY